MRESQMRNKLLTLSDDTEWRDKVKNMSPKQVICLYYKFEKQGRFKTAPKSKYRDIGNGMYVLDT